MTQTEPAATQLGTLRGLVTTATQRLLGDTIAVSDEDWRGPSRLPDWSRGHVATHIARQADGLVRLTEWARTGERQDMYASTEQRAAEIEQGSGRTGLELQIDLDTSAGRLGDAFEAMDEAGAWETVVELRGGLKVPARLLPLTRLLEVVVHHVDLDIGFEFDQIETTTAEWLLEWCAFRLRAREDFPKLQLTSDSGFTIVLGSAGEPTAVSGTSANLLGWVMSRLDRSTVRGDESVQLPPPIDLVGKDLGMNGLNHVQPGGPPLVVRLSPTVTMTKISVGPMDNNAYLLQAAGGGTVLVDAANDSRRLVKVIGDEPLDTIVTTHRHGDHWQGLAAVAKATGARLIGGRPDVDAIAQGAQVGGLAGVWDGDQVELGSESLAVIGLVGHTPGSITLVYAGGGPVHLFTGDSLFPGGPGKTNNPQDFTSLMDDLEAKIFGRFDDEAVVHPGHGDDTTLGVERPHLAEWRARGW